MEILLKEVMLNKINFLLEKNAICFEFYNASSGKDIGKVICENIFKMDMNMSFLNNEEKFPCFVLDVKYSQLQDNEIINCFNDLNYSFRNDGEPKVPESSSYWYFGIEGGPFEVQVISENIEKTITET